MFNPFKYIETIVYRIRDAFWELPSFIFEDNKYRESFIRFYKASSPYSNFISAFLAVLFLFVFLLLGSFSKILGSETPTLREGVVLGIGTDGQIQKINKVNPLEPSNIQLEKDLVELIYEPLIRYELVPDASGAWVADAKPVLAENVIEFRQGSDYQFNLRAGVFWHDGVEFGADDVIRTLDIMSGLDDQNAYIQAIKQLQWEKVDNYTVRICTKPSDGIAKLCDASADRPILSNFLELISVKIIPEHLSRDINDQTIQSSTAKIFRTPVGTGRFKFESVSDRSIILSRNKNYYLANGTGNIDRIEFIFYKTLEEAVRAIESGEVHSLASISSQYKIELEDYPNIQTVESPVLDNQFWSLYFNLRTKPDGSTIGPEFLADKKVRQAISSGVSRDNVINEALSGVGEEAYGPIQKKSFFFNTSTQWYRTDLGRTQQLLNDAGWTLKPNQKFRTNAAGEKLSFSLYFVESFDRRRVAEVIKEDLEKLGIEVIIDRRLQPGQDSSENAPQGWTLKELNEQIVAPRSFDVLLYGMNTFIDPDRYELYHSSQQQHPGLNISWYKGSEETVVAKSKEERVEGESSVKTVSKVDRILEQTRTFDPDKDREERKRNYDEFQNLLADDAPVVFLYHPKYLYFAHDELSNIDMDGVVSIEDRFRNIGDWEIE